MKVSLFVIATLLSTQAWSGVLPDGNYTGKGLWNSPLKQGSYDTTTNIKGNVISAKYTLEDGAQKDWTFEISPTDGKFFKVRAKDHEVGQGYCLSHATVCHYQINVGSMVLEETITFMDGKLYRFGSKTDDDGKVMWQESLE